MNIEFEKQLGQHLRNIRISKGLTQEKVAARLQLAGCDITRSSVAKIEVGQRHIYPDGLVLLKDILNISYDELFNVHQAYEILNTQIRAHTQSAHRQ